MARRPPVVPTRHGSDGTMRLSGASLFSVACYMATSSVLLLLNKLAIHHLQAPNFILTLQLLTSAGAVWVAGQLGVARVDALSWGKAVAFAPVSLTFVALIFANIKTLQFANVETFIVFRASTPVLISLCEWRFLQRDVYFYAVAIGLLVLFTRDQLLQWWECGTMVLVYVLYVVVCLCSGKLTKVRTKAKITSRTSMHQGPGAHQ